MKSPAPSPCWKSIRYYYKQALKHNLFNLNWNATPQRFSITGIYQYWVPRNFVDTFWLRRHFRSFHLACCDAAGAGCWNIGDWVDITHGALYINALWWFMRKCCRQVKDYTNCCCWVLLPPYLTFSVHLCFCLSVLPIISCSFHPNVMICF